MQYASCITQHIVSSYSFIVAHKRSIPFAILSVILVKETTMKMKWWMIIAIVVVSVYFGAVMCDPGTTVTT